MPAYYNEHDPYAAQWLRNLIAAGHIAPGDVDERSIVDVRPDDLRGYDQCHFFAGIGGWSIALRRAGWPDDRPVWTGSCPCQPFSVAGKGSGTEDERHLWPAFFDLIRERRPLVVFGEQVASKDALHWLDAVCADLETEAYAVGAIDTCAAGVGAPHIRQRLYWVADAAIARPQRSGSARAARSRTEGRAAERGGEAFGLADRNVDGRDKARQRIAAPRDDGLIGDRAACGLGHTEQLGSRRNAGAGDCPQAQASLRQQCDDVGPSSADGGVADAKTIGRREERPDVGGGAIGDRAQGSPAGLINGGSDLRPGPTNGHWRDADWLLCRDGLWRPVEPESFPLAHGASGRMGRLRAYGNCIVIDQAKEFIRAYVVIVSER